MAVRDAGLSAKDTDPDRIGVIFGSGIGGMITYDAQFTNYMQGGPRRISPFFIPMLIPDIAAGNISIKHGFKGPNYATVSACATAPPTPSEMRTASCSTAMPTHGVRRGSEAPITPMGLGVRQHAGPVRAERRTGKASRPFDLHRDGFVIGEGGGAIILEELEFALKRGARIFTARCAGSGLPPTPIISPPLRKAAKGPSVLCDAL